MRSMRNNCTYTRNFQVYAQQYAARRRYLADMAEFLRIESSSDQLVWTISGNEVRLFLWLRAKRALRQPRI